MDAGELGSRNMSVTWLEVPAGIDQGLHSHEEAEQVYIVVSGRGTMTVAGDTQEVGEGDPEAVDQLVEFCRRGPSRAEVTSVEVAEEEPEGLSGFELA